MTAGNSDIHMFSTVVQSKFDFLNDLGFVVTESGPTAVRFQKDDLGVLVYHDRGEIAFAMQRWGRTYPLHTLIRMADPSAAAKYRPYMTYTAEGVVKGLTLLEQTVKEYGMRALQNEAEFFQLLDDKLKIWEQEYLDDNLVRYARPKAEEAFRNKDYRLAVELYERIRTHLTQTELKKLAFARQRMVS